ncbi:MAG: RNA polymerase sigma-70 factor [Cyclobacteriaceae bacterium]
MSIFPKRTLDIRTTAGFTLLYQTYLDHVFNICYNYLEDAEVSKNITADIFASIWDRREQLQTQGLKKASWKTYLTRAAKNKIVDHLRSKEQSARYLAASLREFPYYENTTDLELDYEELAEQITEAIEQLPPKCQQVFRLSREADMSTKEIAKKLGKTTYAVKRHIEVALNKLRGHLEAYQIPKRAMKR